MKGDLTRSTFKREKHYSSVRMQQGRVQVDADWNEQADIQAYLRNRAIGDIIGHSGIPLKGGGFDIQPTPDGKDLIISPGRMYVDGVLCELEEAEPVPVKAPIKAGLLKKKKLPQGLTDRALEGGRWAEALEYTGETPMVKPVTTYKQQPYLPAGATLSLDTAKAYLAYLDVWQRHITSIDDPSIREVALGGPDTATRTQAIWQVKLLELDKADVSKELCMPCDLQAYRDLIAPRDARMEAYVGEKDTDEECALVSRGGYRGLENHLYRVEIHDASAASGGKNKATFKWSRDNGSVVRSVEKIDKDTNTITLRVSGQDIPPAFAGGKWVEVTDEKRDLMEKPGTMALLTKVNGAVLTFDINTAKGDEINETNFPQSGNPRVRLWDHPDVAAIPVSPDYIELEDGLQVRFPSDDHYGSGDYWLIPARSVEGTIEWDKGPDGKYKLMQRFGIEHHYACLAVLRPVGGSKLEATDARRTFTALTDPALFYVGGDGQEAMPGHTLPGLLEVCVANGPVPVEGAFVKFRFVTPRGSGLLDGNARDEVKVRTNEKGIASCTWKLNDEDWENNSSIWSQQVEATLLGDGCDPDSVPPVHFYASLSVAGNVKINSTKDCKRLNVSDTVQDAIGKICAERNLFYVGGDGQEMMPGADGLPGPLEAGVSAGPVPLEGALVKFRFVTPRGNGLLNGDKETEVKVPTDPRGIASCKWKLNDKGWERLNDLQVHDRNDLLCQQVEAVLLDAGGNEEKTLPVRFNAGLSVAGDVAVLARDCPRLGNVKTVQDAIDNICAERSMHYVGGDGQEARPGERLPKPLEVGVSSGSRLIKGALVEFSIIEGDGSIAGSPDNKVKDENGKAVILYTNEKGIAGVLWTMGGSPDSQRVGARLLDGETALPIFFNASAEKSGGEGCCTVVVSPGGGRTLKEALAPVLDQGRDRMTVKDICICLAPGEHVLSEPLPVIAWQDTDPTHGYSLYEHINIKIVGCGPASRLVVKKDSPWVLDNLDSFVLKDAVLAFEETGSPLTFSRCRNVSVSSCSIEGKVREGALIKVQNCGRAIFDKDNIAVTPVIVDKQKAVGFIKDVLMWDAGDAVQKLAPEAQKYVKTCTETAHSAFDAGGRAEFSKRMRDLVRLLPLFLGSDKSAAKVLLDSTAENYNKARSALSAREARDYADILGYFGNLIRDLGKARDSEKYVSVISEAFPRLYVALENLNAGYIMAFDLSDGQARVTISDCEVSGIMGLYGHAKGSPKHARPGARRQANKAAAGPGGALMVHGSRLEGIKVMDQENQYIFRSINVSDNVFIKGLIDLRGGDVKMCSNEFQEAAVSEKPVAWIKAKYIVSIGNSAPAMLNIGTTCDKKDQAANLNVNLT